MWWKQNKFCIWRKSSWASIKTKIISYWGTRIRMRTPFKIWKKINFRLEFYTWANNQSMQKPFQTSLIDHHGSYKERCAFSKRREFEKERKKRKTWSSRYKGISYNTYKPPKHVPTFISYLSLLQSKEQFRVYEGENFRGKMVLMDCMVS